MFVAIYFENVLQFCGIWKKYFLRSLTLGVKGAKTRFFKMWPKSMHDQKFEKFFRPRPEDGLYGSNEPKKCEIRPVVSSIVHFKVFKSYFIYIIDIIACWCRKAGHTHHSTTYWPTRHWWCFWIYQAEFPAHWKHVIIRPFRFFRLKRR